MAPFQGLARQWRPTTFNDLKGQDHVRDALTRSIDNKRIAQAYVFSGPRGVGKTSAARLMAMAITCEEGPTSKPCQQCVHCVAIKEGSSLDVIEIDGASHTGVDDIRELRESARYAPTSARAKIFIIDEVHMLSKSAFNALLKILEEPPSYLHFILATTDPQKILPTVLSRCQRFAFKRHSLATIIERLLEVADKEGFALSKGASRLIADAAEGGMRDALSLLDQARSAGDGSATISEDDVRRVFGWVSLASLRPLIEAIVKREPDRALMQLHERNEGGDSPVEVMQVVVAELRRLNFLATTPQAKAYLSISDSDHAWLTELLARSTPKDAQRLYQKSLDHFDSVAKSETPMMVAELAILSLARRPKLNELREITAAIRDLERLHQSILREKGHSVPQKKKSPLGPLHRKPPPENRGRSGSSSTAPSLASTPISKPSALSVNDGTQASIQSTRRDGAFADPNAQNTGQDNVHATIDNFDDDELAKNHPFSNLPLDGIDNAWLSLSERLERVQSIGAAHLTHTQFHGTEVTSDAPVSTLTLKLACENKLHRHEVERLFQHERAICICIDVLSPEMHRESKKREQKVLIEWVSEDTRPTVNSARHLALEKAQRDLEDYARAHPFIRGVAEKLGARVERSAIVVPEYEG